MEQIREHALVSKEFISRCGICRIDSLRTMMVAKRQLIFAFVIATFGVSLLVYGVKGVLLERSQSSWPRTDGIVRSVKIVSSDGKAGRLWCPEWSYEYVVDDRRYVSRRVAFGTYGCKHRHSQAELQASTRPIGSWVSVIYEPGNPHNAALEVTQDGGAFHWLLVASGLLLGITTLHPASWRGKEK
ncbi:MAG: DUF3592 domain-containing protein [Gammaproteobacteria bacterium]